MVETIGAKSYIGITGITTPEETRHIAPLFADLPPTHFGMAGFLIDYESHRNNRGKDRFADPDHLSELLSETKGKCRNALHLIPRKHDTLFGQVTRLLTTQGIYEQGLCQALQINQAWPEAAELDQIKQRFPNLAIILQLGRFALNTLSGKTPKQLPDYNLVDYVLIDPSGGTGRIIDPNQASQFYHLIKKSLPSTSIAIAGGLTPDNLDRIIPNLVQEIGTKHFGIDVETGVRNDTGLDLAKVELFIKKASQLFNSL